MTSRIDPRYFWPNIFGAHAAWCLLLAGIAAFRCDDGGMAAFAFVLLACLCASLAVYAAKDIK